MGVSALIKNWYNENKRDLPWRNTRDPYQIWLSEIILQQTQVIQGTAYYHKFVEAYPTVNILANSSQEHVLKNWQGLGYYSRARNLHFAAQQIISDYNGRFPDTYDEIIKLKGVGEYTAAAISSFAFDEPYAVVDGNVYRVLSRLFAIDTPINSSKGKKEFAVLAQSLIDTNDPATHNQAMMEMGALVCRPHNPNCEACPLQFNCEAFKAKSISNYPVKEKKLKVKKRHLNYVVISDGNDLLVNKREGKGIWQGLYDFPMLESSEPLMSVDEIEGLSTSKVQFDLEFKHILTHQHLYVKFWILNHSKISNFKNYEVISIDSLEDYPLPQLIVRYIKQSDFFKR